MANDQLSSQLDRLETILRALLLVQVNQIQSTDEFTRARPRSLEAVLHEAGFTQSEIGELVNKSQQAVGKRLRSEGVL